MAEIGITSRAELARRVGCSRPAITEIFDEAQKQSALVPDIHRALAWPPPLPLFLSPDTLEVVAMYEALDDFGKGEFIGRLRERQAATAAINASAPPSSSPDIESGSRKKPTRK